MDLTEKLSITDPVTGAIIMIRTKAEVAAKAKSDAAYLSLLTQQVFEKRKKQSLNTEKLMRLDLEENSEKYTLWVSPSDWHRAMKNPLFATEILQNHKDAVNKQACHSLSTNDAREQNSTLDENQSMALPIFDDATGQPPKKNAELINEHFVIHDVLADDSFVAYLLARNRHNLENPAKDKQFRWNEKQTQLLLSLYEEHCSRLDDDSLTSRKFWTTIVEELKEKGHSFMLTQCSTKMDSLKRSYKKVKDHNMTTGNSKKTCDYYDQLDKLFHKKPWIKPLSTSGSNIPMKNIDECDATGNNKRKKSSEDMRQCLENQRKRIAVAESYRIEKLKLFKDLTEILKPNK